MINRLIRGESYLVALAPALIALLAGCGDGVSADAPETGLHQSPIYNGVQTVNNQRHVVHVSGGCTGTLLNDRWVLTAGHCTGGRPLDLGVSYEGSLRVGDYHVEHQHLDLALIRLSVPMPAPAGVTFSNELWYGSTAELINKSVTCFGFGGTGYLSHGVFTISGTRDRSRLRVPAVVNGSVTRSLTQGDSGGPCFYTKNGYPHLAGVTSTGGPGAEGSVTDVSVARRWIDDVIHGDMALQLPGGAVGNGTAVATSGDLQTAWSIGTDGRLSQWSSTADERWERVSDTPATALEIDRDLNPTVTNPSLTHWTEHGTWEPVAGPAQATVAYAAGNGLAWALVDPQVSNWGYQIGMIFDSNFYPYPAFGSQLDAGPLGQVWLTTPDSRIFTKEINFVQRWPGSARDVAVTATAANSAWLISNDGSASRWNGATWQRLPASGGPIFDRIGLDGAGGVWAIASGGLHSWNGTSWIAQSTPESVVDVKWAGGHGVVILGTSGTLYKRTGTSWTASPGEVTPAVTFAYHPIQNKFWFLTSDSRIVTRLWDFPLADPLSLAASEGGMVEPEDLDIGANGSVWIADREVAPNGALKLQPYQWSASTQQWHGNWQGGCASQIDVGNNGELWAVCPNNGVYSMDYDFRQMPGQSNYVNVGVNQQVRVVGVGDFDADGGRVHLWSYRDGWVPQNYGAKTLATDGRGRVTITTKTNAIRQLNGTTWRTLPGAASSVSMGVDGRPWVLGTPTQYVYRYNGGAFAGVADASFQAREIDVDIHGNPWVVDSAGVVRFRSGTTWIATPGTGKDVGVSPRGVVYRIGSAVRTGGFAVERLTNTNPATWTEVNSSRGGLRVDVDLEGQAWICDNANNIYSLTNGGSGSGAAWQFVAGGANGCADVSISDTNIPWKVDPASLNTFGQAARFDGVSWIKVNAYGTKISAGAIGKILTVNGNNVITAL